MESPFFLPLKVCRVSSYKHMIFISHYHLSPDLDPWNRENQTEIFRDRFPRWDQNWCSWWEPWELNLFWWELYLVTPSFGRNKHHFIVYIPESFGFTRKIFPQDFAFFFVKCQTRKFCWLNKITFFAGVTPMFVGKTQLFCGYTIPTLWWVKPIL